MINMKNAENYRLIIIGNDGKIEYFGENKEYRLHLEALKDYFYTCYEDLANKVDADSMRNNEDIIVYLNEFGKIVFLNSKGYGICYIPKDVGYEQKKIMCYLFDGMPDKMIYLEYNLSVENGVFIHQNGCPYTGYSSLDFLSNEGVKNDTKCI